MRTVENAVVVLRSASYIGIVAVAATFITVAGMYFSLSVGAVAVTGGVLFAMCVDTLGAGPALLLTLAVVGLIGVVQGLAVGAGGNPIVVTLATSIALAGLAVAVTDNRNVYIQGDGGNWLGSARPFGVPIQVYWFLGVALAAAVTLKHTVFGRQVALLGANRLTAAAIGINRLRTAVSVFSMTALAAGFVGICSATQTREASAVGFETIDIDVIAAVVVGGTSVAGGRGSIGRTFSATLLIAALNNFMVIRGFDAGARTFLVGVGVLAVVSCNHWIGKMKK
jgi:simple sugar transport system permease protein/ribose transport system permease protein